MLVPRHPQGRPDVVNRFFDRRDLASNRVTLFSLAHTDLRGRLGPHVLTSGQTQVGRFIRSVVDNVATHLSHVLTLGWSQI